MQQRIALSIAAVLLVLAVDTALSLAPCVVAEQPEQQIGHNFAPSGSLTHLTMASSMVTSRGERSGTPM